MPRKNLKDEAEKLKRLNLGRKIKFRRNQLGWTQSELGNRINTSFQQIQKYEGGTNTLTVQRLSEIAEALEVSMSYFLDDYEVYKNDQFQDIYKLSPDNKKLVLQLIKSLKETGI